MAHRLPIAINGVSWQPDQADDHVIEMPNGESLALPALTPQLADEILRQDRFLLRDVPLHEIVAFLNTVGRNWKSTEYSRRRIYVRYLQRFLGYSKSMAELEANWIALLLCSHYRFLDTIAIELGNRNILDQWVANEEAQVRALPRGRSLHVLAGNVPLSGVVSILRALVTKNTCVVKPSTDDPITPVMLGLSFLDANARHPVAKAFNVAYWAGQQVNAQAQRLVQDADVACIWGGAPAMAWASQAFRPETEIVRFGPRRSFAVVGQQADLVETARRLAHNVCMYDQRACFSVRQVFVDERVLPDFLVEARRALERYSTLLPKGFHDFDDEARYSLAELEANYRGVLFDRGDDQRWSLVVCRPEEIEGHPLGRTLYVHPISRLDQVVAHVTQDVQTVAVAPYEIGFELRDQLARAGAARIVDLGLSNVFRIGGTHDAMYPCQRLVRMVCFERPSQEHPKGITIPIDQTTFLEEDRFAEFIP